MVLSPSRHHPELLIISTYITANCIEREKNSIPTEVKWMKQEQITIIHGTVQRKKKEDWQNIWKRKETSPFPRKIVQSRLPVKPRQLWLYQWNVLSKRGPASFYRTCLSPSHGVCFVSRYLLLSFSASTTLCIQHLPLLATGAKERC